MNEKASGRLLVVGGIVVLVVVCFAAGYLFGTRGTQLPVDAMASPEVSPTAGMDAHPAMNGAAPSLSDLLPGLEAKVKAHPEDIDKRMLLVQTYDELGQRASAVKNLRAIHRDAPDNTRATILLATMLIDSERARDLREAYALLDDAARRKPEVEVMARLYQGDIRVKQGDTKGAQAIWFKELARLPADDPRRQMYERKLTETGPAK